MSDVCTRVFDNLKANVFTGPKISQFMSDPYLNSVNNLDKQA